MFLAFLVGCTSVAQAQSEGIRGAFFDFVENPWELTARGENESESARFIRDGLMVIEDGRIVNHLVREGETFFIPPNVPHAPHRPPGTVGVVVERNRPAGETEHQQFYCPNCHEMAWDEEFDCADIVEHFRDSMEAFWADPARSTCTHCGTRIGKPGPVERIEVGEDVTILRCGEES